jgi:hypothetical protein
VSVIDQLFEMSLSRWAWMKIELLGKKKKIRPSIQSAFYTAGTDHSRLIVGPE